jgi:hypothetical protein
VTRFEEAFEQYKRQRLTGEEAGELLGMPLALRPMISKTRNSTFQKHGF